MTSNEVRERAARLITRLEVWHAREERGVLALLRRGLSDTTRCDAWSVLGPWFGPSAIDNPVYETVAGCFALYPAVWESTGNLGKDAKLNFGWTFREARLAERDGKDKMRDEKEPHTRFRRLLACSDRDEICKHVRHAIRLVKSKEKTINYRQLFEDLWWWNQWTKIAWAKEYWQSPAEVTFALAGIGTPSEDEPVPLPE